MLNKVERHEVLKFLRLYSIAGQLPIQVDLASCRIEAPSTKKRISSALFFCLLLLHTLYKNGSLVHVYLFVPDVQLHQLLFHTVVAMSSTTASFWYYAVYIRDRALFASFIRMTLLGNIGVSLEVNDDAGKPWTTGRMKEYSIQDMISMSLPHMLAVSVSTWAAVYIYDPSMGLLLYAALPNRLQCWATYVALLLEESRLLLIFTAVAVPIWQLQVISLELLSYQLRSLKRKIQNGTTSPRMVYKSLRCLQLYVTILNNVNSYVTFTWKLLCISASILCGYAAIAHSREYPVFGVMYYVVVLECIFVYTMMYQKAFKIPQMSEEIATCAALRCPRNLTGLYKRQMLSIPRTGIKVGNFHTMERASTLMFMDFVLSNIVSMLVAYG